MTQHVQLPTMMFFGLFQENLSLGIMEISTFGLLFILLLHIYSSGKHNVMIFTSAFSCILLQELLFYQSKRWHAQANIMIIPTMVSAMYVILHVELMYIAFVTTSRLRLDTVFQPCSMACFYILLLLPLEILGTKFLWWTWHDTDPLLSLRIFDVPVHLLIHEIIFVLAFHISYQVIFSMFGYEDEPKEDGIPRTLREWMVAIGLCPLLSIAITILFLIAFYYFPIYIIGIDGITWLSIILGGCMLLTWIGDREKLVLNIDKYLLPDDHFDSDWLYPSLEHALIQMVIVLSFLEVFLLVCINPRHIVSYGEHQPLGNCAEEEQFRLLIGLPFTRKRYICTRAYDEPFNFCNYPISQLEYDKSWYMICGNAYTNYSTYVAIILACVTFTLVIFLEILKRPMKARQVGYDIKSN